MRQKRSWEPETQRWLDAILQEATALAHFGHTSGVWGQWQGRLAAHPLPVSFLLPGYTKTPEACARALLRKEEGSPPEPRCQDGTHQLHAPPAGLGLPLHQLFHVCLKLLQAPLVILAVLPLLGLGRGGLRELLAHLDQAVPKPDHQHLRPRQKAHAQPGVRGLGPDTGAGWGGGLQEQKSSAESLCVLMK